MKKLSLYVSVLFLSTIVLFSSCKKINEATELGGNLVPEVDNVKTFETSFETITDNLLLNDTAKLGYADPAALGYISSDPEFGQTTANIYFSISSNTYGTNPFSSKENLEIDSVILSLSYAGSYGDVNALQSVKVYEIPQTSSFVDTTFYKYAGNDFETGTLLGSKTFNISTLDDSIELIRIAPRDTIKTANVLRIKLDEELGLRFSALDTFNTANGGFRNDSIFKKIFKGLAIKADAGSGNGLAFFNLSDAAKTNLTVYYRATRNAIKDTAAIVFSHSRNGQANIIKRTPGGSYASSLANAATNDASLYIQSTPGSYASIKIPSLDTFSNNVIHRAELIVTKLNSGQEAIFKAPNQLFLDKINRAGDTAFSLDKDFPLSGQTLNWEVFGGDLKRDGTYRFNITRHIQDIVTRDTGNYTLRLYAPVQTTLYANDIRQRATIPVNARAADGRVVVGGGSHPDPAVRMRLRIVYSKL